MNLPAPRGGLARATALGAATLLVLAIPGTHAGAAPSPGKRPADVEVQLLAFNDYHGQLEAPSGGNAIVGNDPAKTLVGGAEYLSTHLAKLREGKAHSVTVAAGDLIGGTPFLSGLFKDEPAVETLDEMGLDVSGVGNHEFDEGVPELLRMQYGGCHPDEGCFDEDGYDGAKFEWLAANVRYRTGTAKAGQSVLPPTWVKNVGGARIGFIGMTLKGTPEIVAQAGIRDVEFLDEVEAGNAAARELTKQGVKAIVVLLHEGGLGSGTYNDCGPGSSNGAGISGPVTEIARNFDPAIDMVVTGHTHQAYLCNLPDPAGNARWVTSASAYGRIITEATVTIQGVSGEIKRDSVAVRNHLVTRDVAKDPVITETIAKWKALSGPVANRVVGSVAQDINRGTTRQTEGALPNLIADAQLAATQAAADGGAHVAFMNPGGVRTDLDYDQISGGEQPGEVTYGEAFAVQPFGNLVVTQTMSGAAIERVLEQQFTETSVRLLLAVSTGFSYTYDLDRPVGDRIDSSTITLNGVPLDPAADYRVTVNSFLADGGDGFTEFRSGTDRLGGGVDLDAFTAYLGVNSPVAPPAVNRITVG